MKTLTAAAVALVLTGVAAVLSAGASGPNADARSNAPPRLVETGLYLPDRPGTVDPRNRPFVPQYPLWSDGAAKSRWVYLPPGASVDGRDEGAWEFPAGTKFWKEFRFEGRKVETRLLWKAAAEQWVMASYVWNEAQNEATLAPAAGVRGVAAVAPGRRHNIPGVNDCAACHGARRTEVLGFTALQLSPDRDPRALHAEAPVPGMLTLDELVSRRMLAGSRADLAAAPPRIESRNPETRAALGYLATNCGSCHNGRGEITADFPSLRWTDVRRDPDEVARRLLNYPTSWQVPGTQGRSVLIRPGDAQASALHARMRSRQPSSQMPPLGTVLRDDAALAAIARWIGDPRFQD
ncbi:MAG: hypothetical protein AB1635_00340 [Acidobacteriota bacterium]